MHCSMLNVTVYLCLIVSYNHDSNSVDSFRIESFLSSCPRSPKPF